MAEMQQVLKISITAIDYTIQSDDLDNNSNLNSQNGPPPISADYLINKNITEPSLSSPTENNGGYNHQEISDQGQLGNDDRYHDGDDVVKSNVINGKGSKDQLNHDRIILPPLNQPSIIASRSLNTNDMDLERSHESRSNEDNSGNSNSNSNNGDGRVNVEIDKNITMRPEIKKIQSKAKLTSSQLGLKVDTTKKPIVASSSKKVAPPPNPFKQNEGCCSML